MATAQKLKLRPSDHGRPISYDDFVASDSVEGYHYELIDGRVYVSPVPDLPHMRLDRWLYLKLELYSLERPDVINFVCYRSRIFVPRRRRVTCPEPDIAAFHDFPLDASFNEVQWQNVSPTLVAEVLSPDGLDKDLVRNFDLYLRVPSIQEYWVLDGLEDAEEPSLRVHRRRGKRWQIIDVATRLKYTTKLLPGFELVLNPRR
jgi:Uma2 family endonuclease